MKQTQKEKDQRELTYLESQHAALYRDIATIEDRIREVKNRLQVKMSMDISQKIHEDMPVMEVINKTTSELKRLTKILNRL